MVSVPDKIVTPSDRRNTRQAVASGAASVSMVTVMGTHWMGDHGDESSCTGAHRGNTVDSELKRCRLDKSEPAARAGPALTLRHVRQQCTQAR